VFSKPASVLSWLSYYLSCARWVLPHHTPCLFVILRLSHEFSTADSIICTSNGTFNLSPPVCTPVKCPSPPNIPNAQVVPGKWHRLSDLCAWCQKTNALSGRAAGHPMLPMHWCKVCVLHKKWCLPLGNSSFFTLFEWVGNVRKTTLGTKRVG